MHDDNSKDRMDLQDNGEISSFISHRRRKKHKDPNNLIEPYLSQVTSGIMTLEDAQKYSMRYKEKYVFQKNNGRKISFCKEENRYRTRIYVNGKRKLIAKPTYKEVVDYLYNYFLSQEVNLQTAFTSAMQYKLDTHQIKKVTYDNRIGEFKRTFAKYPISTKPIWQVTRFDITDTVLQILRNDAMSARQFGNIKSLLRMAFDYAYDHEQTECVDARRVLSSMNLPSSCFRKVRKSDEDQVFSDDELRMLYKQTVAHPEDIRYAGVMLALLTGLRNGELVALQESDICNQRMTISRAECHEKDKNGHTSYFIGDPKNDASAATIPVSDQAMHFIRLAEMNNRRCGYSGWLFQGPEGRYHTYDMDKAIRRLCNMAGIPERSMHKCRKTYASILIDDTSADEGTVKTLMRHSSFETTQQAYHFARNKTERLSKAADAAGSVVVGLSS
jgi:integrase